MILAIDTGSFAASVALLRDDGSVVERLLYSTEGHAHRLFQEIEALFAEAGCQLAEVDCFAAISGPGSFTGVRVALSAAKGLSAAFDKPMVAVSSLQALAWFGSAPLRAPVLDARRNEIYAALYDNSLALVAPEVVCGREAWLASARERGAELIDQVPPNLATAAAHLADRVWRQGSAADPGAVDANYVRPPDIRE